MRKLNFTLFFLLLPILCHSDWRKDISEYWNNYEDFSSIVKYLENKIDDITGSRKSSALAVLAYAYKNENNSAGEIRNIKELFNNFDISSVALDFLNLSARVKIFDYIERWKKKFPRIDKVSFMNREVKIRFFDPQPHVVLTVYSMTSSELKIFDSKNILIFSGFLKKGRNLLNFPVSAIGLGNGVSDFRFVVLCGLISTESFFRIKKRYIYPEDINFDPVSGNIELIGRDFRKENIKEVITRTKRFFDKRFFLRKSLLPIVIGGLFCSAGWFVLDPGLKSNMSSDSGQLYWSLSNISKTLGIGISLKGIVNFFRSFKKSRSYRTINRKDIQAVRYNRLLKRVLEKKKRQVFMKVELVKKGDAK